jgi:hypothetical protein
LYLFGFLGTYSIMANIVYQCSHYGGQSYHVSQRSESIYPAHVPVERKRCQIEVVAADLLAPALEYEESKEEVEGDNVSYLVLSSSRHCLMLNETRRMRILSNHPKTTPMSQQSMKLPKSV